MKFSLQPSRLLNMQRITNLHLLPKGMFIKISILKSMMYCGILWGLYHPEHHGWAIKTDQQDYIFPFWINGLQAHRYAKNFWPEYVPRKIHSSDFHETLLPTLTRLKVTPALFHNGELKFKLSSVQMHHFFHIRPQLRLL